MMPSDLPVPIYSCFFDIFLVQIQAYKRIKLSYIWNSKLISDEDKTIERLDIAYFSIMVIGQKVHNVEMGISSKLTLTIILRLNHKHTIKPNHTPTPDHKHNATLTLIRITTMGKSSLFSLSKRHSKK